MWECFSSRPPISRYCPLWFMTHKFVQSHIEERRLPHVPYKLEVVVHMPWAQAYKAHVRGVSPWCEIEQIYEANPQLAGIVRFDSCLSLKPIKWPKYPRNPKKWPKYPPKPKNYQKYPQNLKITKIPSKLKKWPKYPRNPKNY